MIVHILEILSYGQLTIGDFKPLDQFPPYDAVMEALADMMDRSLLPEDGGNSEAGKVHFPADYRGGASRAYADQTGKGHKTGDAPRSDR